MLPVFYKGDDIIIPIRVKKDGTYVNLNTEYANVVAVVYTDKGSPLVYGREVGSEYLLQVIDPTLYIIRIPSYISANMSIGTMTLEVKLLKADSSSDDGYFDSIYKVEILYLKDTVVGAYTGIVRGVTVYGDDYNQIQDIKLTGVSSSISDLYWQIKDDKFILALDPDFNHKVAETDEIKYTGTYSVYPVNKSGISGYIKLKFNYKIRYEIREGYNSSIQISLFKSNKKIAYIKLDNTDADGLPIMSNDNKLLGRLSQRIKGRLYFSVEPYYADLRFKFYKFPYTPPDFTFDGIVPIGASKVMDLYHMGRIVGKVTVSSTNNNAYALNSNTYIEYYDGVYTAYGLPSNIQSLSLYIDKNYLNGMYLNVPITNIDPNNRFEIENVIKPVTIIGDVNNTIKDIRFVTINNDIAEGLKEDTGYLTLS